MREKARELAELAAKSIVPITKMPPEAFPVTRPGHRWFSKGSPHTVKERQIPEHQKKLHSRFSPQKNNWKICDITLAYCRKIPSKWP
jgi:hypothetical protein